jgi:hypothetical protein
MVMHNVKLEKSCVLVINFKRAKEVMHVTQQKKRQNIFFLGSSVTIFESFSFTNWCQNKNRTHHNIDVKLITSIMDFQQKRKDCTLLQCITLDPLRKFVM